MSTPRAIGLPLGFCLIALAALAGGLLAYVLIEITRAVCGGL